MRAREGGSKPACVRFTIFYAIKALEFSFSPSFGVRIEVHKGRKPIYFRLLWEFPNLVMQGFNWLYPSLLAQPNHSPKSHLALQLATDTAKAEEGGSLRRSLRDDISCSSLGGESYLFGPLQRLPTFYQVPAVEGRSCKTFQRKSRKVRLTQRDGMGRDQSEGNENVGLVKPSSGIRIIFICPLGGNGLWSCLLLYYLHAPCIKLIRRPSCLGRTERMSLDVRNDSIGLTHTKETSFVSFPSFLLCTISFEDDLG